MQTACKPQRLSPSAGRPSGSIFRLGIARPLYLETKFPSATLAQSTSGEAEGEGEGVGVGVGEVDRGRGEKVKGHGITGLFDSQWIGLDITRLTQPVR